MTSSIVVLEQADDEASFGGKAAQLARSLKAGLPVPDGYALSWEIVARAGAGDRGALGEIEAVFDRIAAPVAVRSSAVGEDGATASFAGQHATVLNVVTRSAVGEAVRAVLASGSSDAARAYRAKRGIAGDPRVGVVVQRLVRAECSGVMFTVDPTTGARAIVIEAGWGLGETIVQGLVVPERVRLDERGRVVERSAGELDVAIVPLDGGGVAEIARDPTNEPALDDARIASLFALAKRCDDVFGTSPGHDVEWAFEAGSAKAVLLQRRAVTTIATKGSRS